MAELRSSKTTNKELRSNQLAPKKALFRAKVALNEPEKPPGSARWACSEEEHAEKQPAFELRSHQLAPKKALFRAKWP